MRPSAHEAGLKAGKRVAPVLESPGVDWEGRRNVP